MVKLAPSILSADFVNLERDIHLVKDAGAEFVHIDVMDGIFVPNITIGIPVTAAIRKITDLFLDVHLMIDRPLRYVERFVKAGNDLVTIHLEAESPEDVKKSIETIHAAGALAGVSIKPGTPAEELLPILDSIDLALVMTVEPGFGGQSFMADMLPKVELLRREIDRRGLKCMLEVDGGVNPVTARQCMDAGADVLVAGSSFFGAEDKKLQALKLKGLI
ncbi:MAG: ribulose-phosphate 3-epimerase [Oscillospiraceae bacterium]|nr:ribulose-phosphate 3-epimerase [Oscillospiraceae bacterium]